MIQWYDADAVEFRTRTLIHGKGLLYIVKESGHQVRPVCPYCLLATATNRCLQDCDGYVQSLVKVPIGSLGENLKIQ